MLGEAGEFPAQNHHVGRGESQGESDKRVKSVNGSVPAIRQFLLDTCSGGRNSGDGMARKIRIQYPGAVYHVMNRGDQRESIFHDDDDRQRFIETLGEACGKTGWQVHAYCLMPNHFHLVVETPQPNWVAGMKCFLGTTRFRLTNSRD